MDNLDSLLREAADNPPPTRIDVDRIIDADQRRVARRPWIYGGAALAALVVVSAVPVALAGQRPEGNGSPVAAAQTTAAPSAGPGVQPTPLPTLDPRDMATSGPCVNTGTPGPQQSPSFATPLPTADHLQTSARLTAALRTGLDAVLPDGVTAESPAPGCDRLQVGWRADRLAYTSEVRLRGPQSQVNWLSLYVTPEIVGEQGCRQPYEGCQVVTAPDGTVTVTTEAAGGGAYSVRITTTDRTTVQLSVTVQDIHSEERPLLTTEGLRTIGSTPGFSLYL